MFTQFFQNYGLVFFSPHTGPHSVCLLISVWMLKWFRTHTYTFTLIASSTNSICHRSSSKEFLIHLETRLRLWIPIHLSSCFCYLHKKSKLIDITKLDVITILLMIYLLFSVVDPHDLLFLNERCMPLPLDPSLWPTELTHPPSQSHRHCHCTLLSPSLLCSHCLCAARACLTNREQIVCRFLGVCIVLHCNLWEFTRAVFSMGRRLTRRKRVWEAQGLKLKKWQRGQWKGPCHSQTPLLQ